MSPYLHTLAKAYVLALHMPHGDQTELGAALVKASKREDLHPSSVAEEVVTQNVEADGYRVIAFDDESAVVFGPEGCTEALTACYHAGGDFEGEAQPGYLHIELCFGAPHWLTPRVVEQLESASVG